MSLTDEKTPRTSRRPAPATNTPAEPHLPFHRPSITDAERRAVLAVLDSGWLTTGPRVQEFQAEFARVVGSRHAIALNSATAALHLALEAAGVKRGDEVIVPTWTFASCGEVVVYLGATPILVDVDARTLNATVETILAAVTPRTRAVIAVHFAGRPMPVEQLVEALRGSGIAVIEDVAHTFPSRIGGSLGRMAGTIGRAGAFSFYATKTITTGEGGMLVTDDDELADRVRVMSLHGISRDAWKRYTASGSWYYEIEDAGYKYNMTDLAAALGLAQLGRAQELLEARRALATGYRSRFDASSIRDLIELPDDEPDRSHAWHLYVIRLNLDRLAIDRGAVMDALAQSGIGVSVHFIPMHLHPYYTRRPETQQQPLSVATHEYERVISLPIWPGMTGADQDRVVGSFDRILSGARRPAITRR